MSRIGDMPIEIASGVNVEVSGTTVAVKGSLGELAIELPGGIQAKVEDSVLVLSRPDDTRQSKSFHGLSRSLVANMVEGVSKGFKKELEIEGVGFRAQVQGQSVSLSLGFAGPKVLTVPDTVTVVEEGGTKLTVSGVDKQQVGEVAARLRSYFPAEPYKGKGIRYKGEHVRRKVGKTVA